MKNKLYAILVFLFEVTLILYMIFGRIIVFGQMLGIITHQPELVCNINKLLKLKATWISSISGLAGFAAYYCRPLLNNSK